MDAEKVRSNLKIPEELKVTIEPSGVVGSPHDYIYIYMGPREERGGHIIVSDLREWEDRDGFLVGVHRHWGSASVSMTEVDQENWNGLQRAVNQAIRTLGRGELVN